MGLLDLLDDAVGPEESKLSADASAKAAKFGV